MLKKLFAGMFIIASIAATQNTEQSAKIEIKRARVNSWATDEGEISENWGNLFDGKDSTIWHST